MKVTRTDHLDTSRVVNCPKGGFKSHRILVEADNTGFSLTKTIVYPGQRNFWHYKHHIESCYCVSGRAVLENATTGETWDILPDTTYTLDNHDPHFFEAQIETVLICVFNPPLKGDEIHRKDGSYRPANGYRSPVYDVRSVPFEKVKSNEYNPNKVAPPEMELLETSIWEDGYTQPIVTYFDPGQEKYIVVDGFHRYRTLMESERIKERERGMLPIVVIDKQIGDRMASTIRHNRARGTHNIELMSSIVAELIEMGKGDRWICEHIGMSKDELLRLKQITGLASLFITKDFSESWDVNDRKNREKVEEGVSPGEPMGGNEVQHVG